MGPWKNTAALCTSFVVFLVLILPSILLAKLIAEEAVTAYLFMEGKLLSGETAWLDALQSQAVVQTAIDWFRETQDAQAEDLQTMLLSAAKQVSLFLAGQIRAMLSNLMQLFFSLGITALTVYFLFRDGESWLAWARRLAPVRSDLQEIVLNQFNQTITAVLYGSVVVAVVQGFFGAIGFWIVGLPAVVLWGSVMAMLSLVPLLGSFLVWFPAAIILLLQGEIWQGVFLIVWGVGVVGMADNFLRPIMIGSRARIPTLMIFLSLLGGVLAFGALGMVVGPLAVAVTVALLEAYDRSLTTVPNPS